MYFKNAADLARVELGLSHPHLSTKLAKYDWKSKANQYENYGFYRKNRTSSVILCCIFLHILVLILRHIIIINYNFSMTYRPNTYHFRKHQRNIYFFMISLISRLILLVNEILLRVKI